MVPGCPQLLGERPQWCWRLAYHFDSDPVLTFPFEANPDPDRYSRNDAVSGRSVIVS